MKTNFSIDYKTIPQELEKESIKFLTGMIERAGRNILEAIEIDNKSRVDGVSYQDRKEIINRISTFNELAQEYKAFLAKGIRPLKEWFEKEDLESLEDNGYEWYVKTYFRRIY